MHRSLPLTFALAAALFAIFASPELASARGMLRTTKAGGGPVAFGSPIQKAGAICEPRCIDYRHHHGLRCKYDPCSTSQLVLQVPDNCCCCLVPVPVCVPCCCEGAPTVCCHKGLFGRDVVEYRWCCGFHLKVVFDRCGDVTVHSYGL